MVKSASRGGLKQFPASSQCEPKVTGLFLEEVMGDHSELQSETSDGYSSRTYAETMREMGDEYDALHKSRQPTEEERKN